MFIPIIIIIVSLLLDGLLTNILPYTVNNLSIFTPMFTILIPIIIYPFYLKEEKKYLITLIITGIIYDIFYTNLLFYNAIVLFIFGLIIIKLYKNIGYNYIKVLQSLKYKQKYIQYILTTVHFYAKDLVL